ncbi:MAG: Carbohydrate-binding family 9 [Paenibacillaceae bacterium]|jgi:hypothetical protein|nr:Carbohydrate-binding family 9 [Paenibacillaceae bacterium]
MKKIMSLLVIASLLLALLSSAVYASPSITVAASVDQTVKRVYLSGTISSGQGQQLSLIVVNPSGGTDYMDQIISGPGGSFQFTYVLDELVGGTYSVYVGGTGITSPISTQFTYAPESEGTALDSEAPSWHEGAITATNVSQTGLTFSWSGAADNTAVTQYRVYQGEALLASVPGAAYDVTGLTAGTAYTFHIQAGDASGNWSVDGPSKTIRTSDSIEINDIPTPTPTTAPTPTPASTPAATNKLILDKPLLHAATGEATASVKEGAVIKALTEAKTDSNGFKTAELVIPAVEGATAYVLELPPSVLSSGSKAEAIEVKTAHGTVILPANMLNASEVEGAQKVALTIARVDGVKLDAALRAKTGGRPVVEISLKLDGSTKAWSNPNAPVTVSVPYRPSAAELADSEHLVVWYIDGSGRVTSVPSGRYAASDGAVTFTTTHLSQYAIAYVHRTFQDLTDYPWAQAAIEVMASKGIINGATADCYAPSEAIKRADFMLLLVNALGLNAAADTNFSDVDSTSYYYEALAIAKKLGIADGEGDNRFNPEAQISRQDVMTLADRAMTYAGKNLSVGSEAELGKFADKSRVADYAVRSVATLVKDGFITGDGANLHPLDYATRAEAAVIIYRIYNK